jgi:hypothetical protein
MTSSAETTLEPAASPMRVEVALMLPLSLTSELVRQLRAVASDLTAQLRPLLDDTVLLFPRLVVALEQIAQTNQAIIALGESSPNLGRLADSTDTLERLADALPVLQRLAEATTSLEQLARLAETSGQIEKLANATVVAPLQGTAERVGRFVERIPGNPWSAAARSNGRPLDPAAVPPPAAAKPKR